VIRALNHDFAWLLDYGLHLMNVGFVLLHLRNFLARPVEFQQCHTLRYTYCIYVHTINIMDA
jgi:hypothetical protein